MRPHLLVLAIAVALLAGCGAQPSAAAGEVETSEVTMPPSYRFDPPRIRVPAGTTVTWRNTDNFTHSVSVAGGDFPLLNLAPGEAGSITFDQRGGYDYLCTFPAQDMRGTVTVVAR
nr:MAG: plastocyanin [Chloroflexota bacterium]